MKNRFDFFQNMLACPGPVGKPLRIILTVSESVIVTSYLINFPGGQCEHRFLEHLQFSIVNSLLICNFILRVNLCLCVKQVQNVFSEINWFVWCFKHQSVFPVHQLVLLFYYYPYLFYHPPWECGPLNTMSQSGHVS